jgi:serine/threonine-protein kinase RsbW
MTVPLRLSVRHTSSADEAGLPFQIALAVPSDLGLVEQVVDLVARHSLAAGLPPRRVRFHLRTALAEALANAMRYGNRLDQARTVSVRVEFSVEATHLHVADEGDGFDPARVPDPTAPDRIGADGGRGLFLIRSLVDGLEFNQKGNALCMTLRRT